MAHLSVHCRVLLCCIAVCCASAGDGSSDPRTRIGHDKPKSSPHIALHDALFNAHDDHHFVVSYSHRPGVSQVSEALQDSHPHHVAPRTYLVWSSLHRIYEGAARRKWNVTSVRLVEAEHKRGAVVKHGVEAVLFVIAPRSMERNVLEWTQMFRAQSISAEVVHIAGIKYEVTVPSSAASTALHALTRRREVRWAERAPEGILLNDIATCTTQSDVMDQHPLWDAASPLKGKGELILVADSGLNVEHCLFKDESEKLAYYPKMNYKHRKVVSYKKCVWKATGSEDAADNVGHGTHVTGSICGSLAPNALSNEGGTAGPYTGLAHEAKIIFSDQNCKEQLPSKLLVPKDVDAHFDVNYKEGGRVSHNSWGAFVKEPNNSIPTFQMLDREIDDYVWRHPDYVVVVSAGNSAAQGILSPASAKNVIAVGVRINNAFQEGTTLENMGLGHYAHGPAYDGRIKPDVVSPGQYVTSADSESRCGVIRHRGTSMASPFVTAASALIRQYFREAWHPGGVQGKGTFIEPSYTLVRAMLIHSARHVAGVESDPNLGVPNNQQGWGAFALQDVLQVDTLHVVNQHYVVQDEQFVVGFDVNTEQSDLRVTMCFLDYPAAYGAEAMMVNDIDLVLVTPSGKLLYGNENREARSTEQPFDRLNVCEKIRIEHPEAGTYRAMVYGYHVVEHDPYAGVPISVVVTAPGIVVHDGVQAQPCPNDCSGNGVCDTATGLCECEAHLHHVDCSVCNHEGFCHGHGTCEGAKCACDGFFAGDRCDRCQDGFHGSNCDTDCACSQHGSCDTSLPPIQQVCRCDEGYGGADCSTCARGRGGDDCATPTHWCSPDGHVALLEGEYEGHIQINSYNKYQNGRHCDWKIVPLNPAWWVELTFVHFQIEAEYDWLWVFQDEPNYGHQLQSFTGSAALQVNGNGTMWVQGATYIRFMSDYVGAEQGFLISYKVHGSCEAHTCGLRGRCASPAAGSQHLCSCDGHYDPATLCTSCAAGSSGAHCYPSVDCMLSPCSGHGECVANACACTPGYGGKLCDLQCPGKDHIPSGTCNSGVCVRNADTQDTACDCTGTGKTGHACQVDLASLLPFDGIYAEHYVGTQAWLLGSLKAHQSVRLAFRTHNDWAASYKVLYGSGSEVDVFLAVWDNAEYIGSTDPNHAVWFQRGLGTVPECTVLATGDNPMYVGAVVSEERATNFTFPLIVDVLPVEPREDSGCTYSDIRQTRTLAPLEHESVVGTGSTPAPKTFLQKNWYYFVVALVIVLKVIAAHFAYQWWIKWRMRNADEEFAKRTKEREDEAGEELEPVESA